MNVVVVESPAKAKTLNKYLGKDFKVLASYGHVRDLPPKDGSVRPAEDFAMDWQIGDRAEKPLQEISDALNGGGTLYLATDPDREGEAISWHIQQILRDRQLLDDVDVKRVVFHEITESAVKEAFEHPRELNKELIEAYLARRALDYLVGFTLSPVLWRKLPGSRSAGRVQSVALRLISDRESEIEKFKPREYWSVVADLKTVRGELFKARLTHLDGDKLERFDIPDEAAATTAKAKIEARDFTIDKVEKRRIKRNPRPPFTTSTLQQEASRKLGIGATQTMRLAQRLYEGVEIEGETVGLISYMRTDSVALSNEAVSAAREQIDHIYGADYLPARARIFKPSAKNAQEAHEAIRPTDLARRPERIAARLNADEAKLYDLIWRRTVASQMAEAEIDKVRADLFSADRQIALRANGSTTAFDGFLKVYKEDRDDKPATNGADNTAGATEAEDDDEENRLPPLAEGEPVTKQGVLPSQHFTQPPPRYTEASLVKKLEELGIGRPSTYASILQVLQDRKYVVLENKRFVPEDRGRLVTSFLASFFRRYVEYDFTADLEDQLDKISNGEADWKQVLANFWSTFSAAVEDTKDLRTRAILDALNEDLGAHFFTAGNDGAPARACPACEGELSLKLGRHGPFIGCSRYPECKYTRRLGTGDESETDTDLAIGPKVLGVDPETGLEVTLRKGPYGLYVQLGEPEGKTKPKRTGVPKDIPAADVDFGMAQQLLALPREIGLHPDDGKPVQAGLGRYGPYVKHGSTYATINDPYELFSIGLNRAVTLLAEKAAKGGRRSPNLMRELGPHPEDGKPVNIYDGRYGPYIKHGRINATVPNGADPQAVTMEEAVALLQAKAAKKKAGKKNGAAGGGKASAGKSRQTKKAAAKRSSAKASSGHKTAGKKASAKKATARTDENDADKNDDPTPAPAPSRTAEPEDAAGSGSDA